MGPLWVSLAIRNGPNEVDPETPINTLIKGLING